MAAEKYFLEGENETVRLERKTDKQRVIEQARWAGLKPGMRILDVACGPGLTTSILSKASEPGSYAVGVDLSVERIQFARENYSHESTLFCCRDLRDDLSDLGEFDFIWMRFLLEYYREGGGQIVKHLSKSLKPGGVFCLIDLDNNPLVHYGMSEHLEKKMLEIMNYLSEHKNYDPFAGRKLPVLLQNAGLEEIRVDVCAHHLIYGELNAVDRDNWWEKLTRFGLYEFLLDDYPGGRDGFVADAKEYFTRTDRFTYTPMVMTRGVKA